MEKQAPKRISKQIILKKIGYAVLMTIWAIVVIVASQLLVALIMSFLLGLKVEEPLWMTIYYILSYGIALAVLLLISPKIWRIGKNFKITKKEIGFGDWPTLVGIGLAPIGYILYIIVATALTAAMRIFPWYDPGQTQNVGFGYLLNPADKIFAIIALVFAAPIFEEILMRGWLYGKLRQKVGVVVAIILTSLAFAVLHGQWNVGAAMFVLSAILCGLREITGTIWSGILVHMITNGISFYLLFIAI